MAKDNKLRLIYLYKVFCEYTDENHKLTREEIADLLMEKYGAECERKTFYKEIALLDELGVDIINEKKGHDSVYCIGNRLFELPELKILVDSVQSSKFITQNKSSELIKKLENLTSKYDAVELDRQVYVTERIKNENEKIYYTVDYIHHAINNNKKIEFQYFDWNYRKEKVLRHDGKIYKVSPWTLIWDNLNYYMIGFDENVNEIRHYRVDKIINVSVSEEERCGLNEFNAFNAAEYSNKLFGMFDGTEENVTIEADESMVNILFDRFGMNIPIIVRKSKKDECWSGSPESNSGLSEHIIETRVNVVVSDQFLCWILGLGNKVRITGPKNVVDMMREMIRERGEIYHE
ncbi:MAG: WYL domain-containing protein [Eubacterium sp.]|nr:WYL domain-containing protein [Eubacterium sp.]